MLMKYFKFLASLSYVNQYEWQCAIRKIESKGMLFEHNLSAFTLIPNSIRYWYADPFLFKYGKKEYLFVEMYDRKTQKGCIGYAQIKNNKKIRFKKCIELPYHLSYPCIYEHAGKIYMVPECYQSERIVIYECQSFPCKWAEKESILDQIAVDTTPYLMNGNLAWFTTFFESKNKRINDNLFLIKEHKIRQLKRGDLYSRSAGHIFTYCNKIIRPSQDCNDGYGSNIIFSQIDVLNKTEFRDHIICKISPPNHKCADDKNNIKLKNKSKHKWEGLHTYNFDDEYEVIDLKYHDGRNVYAFFRNLKSYLKFKLGRQ